MDRFFVVTPPGFEREAEQEMREIWPDLLTPAARPHALPVPEVRLLKGGFEIETEPFAAFQLNFFLRTASRVLWRLDSFRVRDFPKLHERLRKIDVARVLGPGNFTVKAAASSSRLGHEGRIEETARSAWKVKIADDEPAVYLRLEDDVCMVSLDTSGEHLHRRGVNLERGEAPMRETLAAFCLRQMIRGEAPASLREVRLVDPMCGSGTLLTEAAGLWGGSFRRAYRFQGFRGVPKLFQQPGFARNYRDLPPSPFGRLWGCDRDEAVLKAAKNNAARAAEDTTGAQFEFRRQDLFTATPRTEDGPLWLVCNPPYGERLGLGSAQEVLDHMLRVWRPQRLGVLWTEEQLRRLRWPESSRRVAEIPVKNGGIEGRFVVRAF